MWRVLIGYDQARLQRGSDETSGISLNFAAGKAVFEQGSIEADAPMETKTQAIPRRELPCLQAIGSGFEFDTGVTWPFSG